MLEDSAPSSACSQAAMSEEPARRWADFSGALKKTEPRSEPAGSGGVHVTRAGARPGREGTKGGWSHGRRPGAGQVRVTKRVHVSARQDGRSQDVRGRSY